MQKSLEINVESSWRRLRRETARAAKQEPALAVFMAARVAAHADLASCLGALLADRLAKPDDRLGLDAEALRRLFAALYRRHRHLVKAAVKDLLAVIERDPAVEKMYEPLLFFKGFHALQAHRLAHALWQDGRKDMALYLQSRSSAVFQTDIHPAARIGCGVMIDHATGVVIGSTAVVEDDVSILHGVTLGGTGKEKGDRHPKIRHGVMIGADAIILGNIEVGAGARIAAGSVVIKPVPPHTTVAGNPSRVVGIVRVAMPAKVMDQVTGCGLETENTQSGKSREKAAARR